MKAPYAEKVMITPMNSASPRPQPPRDGQERADAARLPRWGPKATLLEAVESAGEFKILTQALRDSHLDELLSEKGPFTLFAPVDDAFARMSSASLHALLADGPRLRALLSSHIVASKVRAPRERVPNTATALDGHTLTMSVRQSYYRVNEAQIVKTNLRASNGVIHAIDSLLGVV